MFLYINNELSKNRIKKTIPFKIKWMNKKIIRYKLNQRGKIFVQWKYKTMKEIKKDTPINEKTSYVYGF